MEKWAKKEKKNHPTTCSHSLYTKMETLVCGISDSWLMGRYTTCLPGRNKQTERTPQSSCQHKPMAFGYCFVAIQMHTFYTSGAHWSKQSKTKTACTWFLGKSTSCSLCHETETKTELTCLPSVFTAAQAVLICMYLFSPEWLSMLLLSERQGTLLSRERAVFAPYSAWDMLCSQCCKAMTLLI